MIRLIPKPFQKIDCQKIELKFDNLRVNNPVALVRTCKREKETLDKTLESLKSIGFTNPIIYRDEKMIGSISSFKLACYQVLDSYSGWCLLCEDDVIFRKSTYQILDKLVISENQTISLFCTAEQDTLLTNWGWNKVIGDFHVSVAYFVHTTLLKKILESKTLSEWQRPDRVDQMWSFALEELGADFIIPKPSLCQHIGETSTIGKHRVLDFRRVSYNFRLEA